MSRRGSRPWNWDSIDCPKFVDFENADTPQESRSLESYFDAHQDSPPITVRRKLAALSSSANTAKLKSLENVDHASQGEKGRGTQPQKSACTSNVSGSDHAKAPRSNASPSCVHKPNYALHSLKQGRPTRGTQDQTSSLPSSSPCRSASGARSYSSNPPSGTGMSSLLSKFSSLHVRAGDNAKQASQASKVSQVENVEQAGNAKERSLSHAEPRKPGQPLHAQNMKAVLCSHPAITKQAGLSKSTKTAAQPITAKQAIRASKVSQVEHVKRRSPPHAEPRKPGQPLRAQNMNPTACNSTAVTRQTGLSRATKTAAQPVAATAPRTKPGPIAGPWRYVGRATMNGSTLRNYGWDKTRASATESHKGVCDKELKK